MSIYRGRSPSLLGVTAGAEQAVSLKAEEAANHQDVKKPTGTSSSGGMGLMLRQARKAANLTRGYVRLKDKVFTSEEWALFNFTEDDLYERDVIIAAITRESDESAVLAGLNLAFQANGIVYLGGLLADHAWRRRGLASAILSITLNWLSCIGVPAVELSVRILPNGDINQAAYATFIKFGFKPVEDCCVAISGTHVDAHLKKSSEAGGKSFRCRKMRLDLLRSSSSCKIYLPEGRLT